MGSAGYPSKIKVESATGVWSEIPAVSGNLNAGGEVLDITELSMAHGFHERILGLRDWSVSMNCKWTASNTALDFIRAAWTSRSDIDIQFLPAGVVGSGWEGTCVVESFVINTDVAGDVSVDISLQGDGALGAAS